MDFSSLFGGGGGGDKEFGSSQAYAYVLNQRGKDAGQIKEWVPLAILGAVAVGILLLVALVAKR